jgi:HKD family nuclease
MQLRFIGQGADSESNVTTGNFLINSLESENYKSFQAFVAFVSTSGLKNIANQLFDFKIDLDQE